MLETKIRPLVKEDILLASQIAGRAFEPSFSELAVTDISAMFVDPVSGPRFLGAEVDGGLVGFGGYTQSWMEPCAYELFWGCVDPAYQRQGVGKALIKSRLSEIRAIEGPFLPSVVYLSTSLPRYFAQFSFRPLSSIRVSGGIRTLMKLNL